MIPIIEEATHKVTTYPLEEIDLNDPDSIMQLLDTILALPTGSYVLAPAHIEELKQIASEAKKEVLRRRG